MITPKKGLTVVWTGGNAMERYTTLENTYQFKTTEPLKNTNTYEIRSAQLRDTYTAAHEFRHFRLATEEEAKKFELALLCQKI